MSAARALDSLGEGEAGRVAYLASPESPEAQRLLSLGLVPGASLRVDQSRPAIVVTVEENTIAMEASVAKNVFVSSGDTLLNSPLIEDACGELSRVSPE